jgi:hypothetical protein
LPWWAAMGIDRPRVTAGTHPCDTINARADPRATLPVTTDRTFRHVRTALLDTPGPPFLTRPDRPSCHPPARPGGPVWMPRSSRGTTKELHDAWGRAFLGDSRGATYYVTHGPRRHTVGPRPPRRDETRQATTDNQQARCRWLRRRSAHLVRVWSRRFGAARQSLAVIVNFRSRDDVRGARANVWKVLV